MFGFRGFAGAGLRHIEGDKFAGAQRGLQLAFKDHLHPAMSPDGDGRFRSRVVLFLSANEKRANR